MKNEKKLIEDFQKEVWLYLSGELTKERIKYWKKNLNKNSGLREMLKDAQMFEKKINRVLMPDFTDLEKDDLNLDYYLHGFESVERIKNVRQNFSLAPIAASIALVLFFVFLSVFSPPKKTSALNNDLTWNPENIDYEITDIREKLKIIGLNYNRELSNIIYGKNSFEGKMLLIKDDVSKIKDEILSNKF